jgi:hypothetical protein
VQRDTRLDLLGIRLAVAKRGVDQRSRHVLLGSEDLSRLILIGEVL